MSYKAQNPIAVGKPHEGPGLLGRQHCNDGETVRSGHHVLCIQKLCGYVVGRACNEKNAAKKQRLCQWV